MENKLNLVIAKLNEIKADYFEDTLKKWNEIKESANFGYTDLKLHHASYFLYQAIQSGILTDQQSIDLFSHMCDIEYDSFTDWESEEIPNIERVYIGHTSSFYYQPKNWSEAVIGYGTVEELLKGRKVSDQEIFGDLNNDLYDFLFNELDSTERYASEVIESIHNQLEEDHSLDEFKSELDELFLDEQLLLEDIYEELKELEEIVQECKKAYDYLEDFKTKENEIELATSYLEHEVSEYTCETLADKIYDNMIDTHTPLNKLTALKVYVSEQDQENEKYTFTIESNLKTTSYETEIERAYGEIAELLVKCTLEALSEKINENFSLEGDQ